MAKWPHFVRLCNSSWSSGLFSSHTGLPSVFVVYVCPSLRSILLASVVGYYGVDLRADTCTCGTLLSLSRSGDCLDIFSVSLCCLDVEI